MIAQEIEAFFYAADEVLVRVLFQTQRPQHPVDQPSCWVSHNLHSRTLHSVINFDVFLRRAEIFVPCKLHNHLGRNTAVRKFGDKAASSAVAGCAFDASFPIKLSKQLAEGIGRKGAVLLSAEQRS